MRQCLAFIWQWNGITCYTSMYLTNRALLCVSIILIQIYGKRQLVKIGDKVEGATSSISLLLLIPSRRVDFFVFASLRQDQCLGALGKPSSCPQNNLPCRGVGKKLSEVEFYIITNGFIMEENNNRKQRIRDGRRKTIQVFIAMFFVLQMKKMQAFILFEASGIPNKQIYNFPVIW